MPGVRTVNCFLCNKSWQANRSKPQTKIMRNGNSIVSQKPLTHFIIVCIWTDILLVNHFARSWIEHNDKILLFGFYSLLTRYIIPLSIRRFRFTLSFSNHCWCDVSLPLLAFLFTSIPFQRRSSNFIWSRHIKAINFKIPASLHISHSIRDTKLKNRSLKCEHEADGTTGEMERRRKIMEPLRKIEDGNRFTTYSWAQNILKPLKSFALSKAM